MQLLYVGFNRTLLTIKVFARYANLFSEFYMTMDLNNGILSVAEGLQKWNELAKPLGGLLDMQKEMDALRPPKFATAMFEEKNKMFASMDAWKPPTMLLNALEATAPFFDFWKEQRENNERLWGIQLHKGVSLSAASDIFGPSIQKAALYNPVGKFGTGFFTASEAPYFSFLKTSRIINAYRESNYDLYKIDYDLSKAYGIDEEESAIIAPTLIIKEAKEIKKVIQDIYKNNTAIFNVVPRQFEELIAELLDKRGYSVELTKQTRDGGYDILALRHDNGMPLKYLVECKKYRKDRKVGIEIIRSFADVVKEQQANKGIIFTTSYFSEDARKRQRVNPYFLQLNDHDEVINWVNGYITGQ